MTQLTSREARGRGRRRRTRAWGWGIALCGLASWGGAPIAAADDGSPEVPRQALADAWWTGPILAPNASSFPAGHALVEPYVFDVMSNARFDAHGNRQSYDGGHELGSLTYVIYALTDRLSVGFLPRFGYDEPAGAQNSSAPGVGDFGIQAQYGLTSYHEGSLAPATAVLIGETFPTGRYDRLSRPSDGFGAGAYTTTLAWYSQDYLWMPNGRILRVRLDLTYTISSSASVEDSSVYGTSNGFRGRAWPRSSYTADAAAEYSLTRNWVLATDLLYQYNASTRLAGAEPSAAGGGSVFVNLESGLSDYIAVAPAVEYNWSSRAGVIVGARVFVAGRNISSSVTPVAAINLVF